MSGNTISAGSGRPVQEWQHDLCRRREEASTAGSGNTICAGDGRRPVQLGVATRSVQEAGGGRCRSGNRISAGDGRRPVEEWQQDQCRRREEASRGVATGSMQKAGGGQ